MSLPKINKGKNPGPPRIVLYGPGAIGKTTLAAQIENAIIINVEDGLGNVDCDSFDLCKILADVIQQLQGLWSEEHDYRWLVIDTMDWLEQLIWKKVCEDNHVSEITEVGGGYGHGMKQAMNHWQDVLNLLNGIRSKRGMGIMLLAHDTIRKHEEPGQISYDTYEPRLQKNACSMFCDWSDAVLFAHAKMSMQTVKEGFGRERGIASAQGATPGGDRVIATVKTPSFVAKNRYNLEPEIPLDWEYLAVSMGIKKPKTEEPTNE